MKTEFLKGSNYNRNTSYSPLVKKSLTVSQPIYQNKEKKTNYYNPIRVGFVGLCGVGKTAIIQRFVNNSFSLKYDPTLEVRKFVCLTDLNMEDDEGNSELAYIVIED